MYLVKETSVQTEIALGRKNIKGRIFLQLGKRSWLTKPWKNYLLNDDILARKAFRERHEDASKQGEAVQDFVEWKECKASLIVEQMQVENKNKKIAELREIKTEYLDLYR